MKTKLKLKIIILPLILGLALIVGSCNTTKTFRGGAIGAGAGGAIGGLIGSGSNNTATGAIIGAAIGGTAGAVIGKYMDKQAEELDKDLEGVEVERVGEGIKLTFDSGILFGFDSSDLTDASKANLSEMAKTLKKYEDTEIVIAGHTDSKGSKKYNQKLSEQRAAAVANQLRKLGVSSTRIEQVGHGEEVPTADNSTEFGRSKNRRVEIAIVANEKLKKEAEKDNLISE